MGYVDFKLIATSSLRPLHPSLRRNRKQLSMKIHTFVALGLWTTFSQAHFPNVGGGVDKYWETDGTRGSGPYKVCSLR